MIEYNDFNRKTQEFFDKVIEVHIRLCLTQHIEVPWKGKLCTLGSIDKIVASLFIASFLVDGELKNLLNKCKDLNIYDFLNYVKIMKYEIKPLYWYYTQPYFLQSYMHSYRDCYNYFFRDYFKFIAKRIGYDNYSETTKKKISPIFILYLLHFYECKGGYVLKLFFQEHNILVPWRRHDLFKYLFQQLQKENVFPFITETSFKTCLVSLEKTDDPDFDFYIYNALENLQKTTIKLTTSKKRISKPTTSPFTYLSVGTTYDINRENQISDFLKTNSNLNHKGIYQRLTTISNEGSKSINFSSEYFNVTEAEQTKITGRVTWTSTNFENKDIFPTINLVNLNDIIKELVSLILTHIENDGIPARISVVQSNYADEIMTYKNEEGIRKAEEKIKEHNIKRQNFTRIDGLCIELTSLEHLSELVDFINQYLKINKWNSPFLLHNFSINPFLFPKDCVRLTFNSEIDFNLFLSILLHMFYTEEENYIANTLRQYIINKINDIDAFYEHLIYFSKCTIDKPTLIKLLKIALINCDTTLTYEEYLSIISTYLLNKPPKIKRLN